MSSSTPNKFRFRPRFRAFAVGAIVVGFGLVALAVFIETGRVVPLAGGGAGVLLGLLYLGSPTWRLTVLVDDEAIEVSSPSRKRFRLPWTDVKEVVASPSTKTCFVDGGKPERSLLVPGPGASAGYDIENKHVLFDAICERVPKDRIREVELLETAQAAKSSGDGRGESEASESPDAGDAGE